MKKLLFSNQPIAQDLGLLIIRLSAGGMMAYSHGWGKLLKLMSGDMSFADPIGVGEEVSLVLTVFAEFFCGILVALGLFTRAALIPLIITMWVAVFMIHANDPFGKQEFGLLYLAPYLALYFTGPGKISLDKQVL
ncbi:MAG: DoxX family protein [Flavobacteriales bacterium]